MAGNLQDFSDADFDARVMQADQPVLVDFWAEWCGPCKALTPTIEKLADEFAGRMVVGKVDIQNNPLIAGRMGIRSIPALMFFRDGQMVDSLMGGQPEDRIRERMEQVLSEG